jgi:uncharacterized protein
MAKQLLLPLAAVALFIILVGLFTQRVPSQSTTPLKKATVVINNKNLEVEIVDTEALRQKGLGGRTSLPGESGMLFVFETKKVNPVFWMKDMLIPLDIIWIVDGKIIKIDKNIPAPIAGTTDDKLIKFSPGRPVDNVLEVNAGFTDSNNIKTGNAVDLSKI